MLTPLNTCTACGGPLGPRQDYCLECGARIVRPEGVPHALGAAWRRRIPWYPGDWIWPSLAALVVAAGGTAAAMAVGQGRSATGPETVIALSRLVPAPAPAARPRPKPPAATPGKPTAAPKPRARPFIAWPDRNGFTIVLKSIPLEGGASEARDTAAEALARRLPEVGILISSRFSSLHPGYYVVFSGVYSSLEDAQAAVSSVKSKFPQAYPREVAR